MENHCFVGLPTNRKNKCIKTYLYKANRKSKVREVLWGDWLSVDGEEPDGWLRINWAPNGASPETLFIPKIHTTTSRPMEVIFLDVGQGDGAVVITPERDASEAIMVVDAGISEHMYDFLSRRFSPYNKHIQFHAAIITHPDEDHYGGFETIFGSPKFGFDVVYHNGLVERPVSGKFEKFGGTTKDPGNKISYINNLATNKEDIETLFGNHVDIGNFKFPKTMRRALENENIHDFQMLSTGHGVQENGSVWLPGFAPSDGRGYEIEVVGPVVEFNQNNAPRLRKIGSYGETKNGHSVLLKLHIGSFSVLFGGDLNDKAEKYLLQHYGNKSKFPVKGSPDYQDMIEQAGQKFRSSIMKVCHHGSEKVTDAFLEAVAPAAFVISSGDEEGHVHPRPDLLGRLGKFGRGDAPVILSTELQRSTREAEDEKLVRNLSRAVLKLRDQPTDKLRDQIINDIWTLGGTNVSVYGTIYLKTDGKNLITAFRIETASEKKKWFTFQYRVYPSGKLYRVP